jgi:AcrR family transcriptional regulator
MAEKKDKGTIHVKTQKPAVRKLSRDTAKGEQLREKVYKAVVKTLLKRRSGEFTLDEIATQIGATKGIIYYYFKSKGDMLYQLNNYFFDFIFEAINPAVVNPDLNARQKLEFLLRNYILVACKHWQLASVLWSDMALREMTSGQASGIIKRRRDLIHHIADQIDEMIQVKLIQPVDTKVASLMVFGAMVYVSTWYKKGGTFRPQEVADYTVKMVFEGLLNNNQNPSC